ncbi:hypothetical protein B0H13DRAFT_2276647 [Mycena leptocephala]|nr:hypothetical protein B0H13DRAFT_2276647 [Mycena leptocephala]
MLYRGMANGLPKALLSCIFLVLLFALPPYFTLFHPTAGLPKCLSLAEISLLLVKQFVVRIHMMQNLLSEACNNKLSLIL